MKDRHAENRANDGIKHKIQILIYPCFYLPLVLAFLEHRRIIQTGWPLHTIANVVLFALLGVVGLMVFLAVSIQTYRLFKDWNKRNELAELSNSVGASVGEVNLTLILRTAVFYAFLYYGGLVLGANLLVGLIGSTVVITAVVSTIAAQRWKYLAVTLPRRNDWKFK